MSAIEFSYFSSAMDKYPKLRKEDSWPEFEAFLETPRRPKPVPPGDDPKKGMEAISPALFKPGTTRAVANVECLTLFLQDYDNSESIETGEMHLDKDGRPTGRPKLKKVCIKNPVRMEDVARVLRTAGVDFHLHPTWSDQPDWPHFRLITPLAQPVLPQHWDRAVAWLIKHLGLEPFLRGVDLPVMKDVARIYFLPGGPHGR